MIRRRTILAAGLMLPAIARAQTYPSRTITIIAPFAPGASADSVARIVGEGLSKRLGQTIIIDNKPGAGGTTGLMSVSHADPDGYTFGIGATGAVVVNPHIPSASAGFKPLEELTAVSMLVDVPLVIVASPNAGFTNAKELVEASKKSEGGLSYGTTGVNSSQYLSMESLKRATGANFVHVPYKGSAPAVTDVLGGQLPLACVDGTSAAPYIAAGNLRAIAVTSGKRAAFAPEIPTIGESGIPNVEMTAFLGLFAPPGLDNAVSAKIAEALAATLADQSIKQRIIAIACSPNYLPAPEFAQYLTKTSAQMQSLLTALGSQ